MEDCVQCSVGSYFNEECHQSVYGAVLKEIVQVSALDEETLQLLKFRVHSQTQTLCRYHEKKYLYKFHHIFGQRCCDPFLIHKKAIKKGLREILIDHVFKNKNANVHLVPGKSVCTNCFSKLFVDDIEHDEPNQNDIFEPAEVNIQKVDNACNILGISPASKLRKLSHDKRAVALQSKVERVSSQIKRNLEIAFDEHVPDVSKPFNSTDESLAEEYNNLIRELKEKCKISSKEEKVKIISLLPKSWPRWTIAAEFGISERLIKVTHELVKEQGILPDLQKRKGVNISDLTINKVIQFYEDDNNSRLLPGKKDCVSVVIDGVKTHKQKRLVLVNLNELFISFKNDHPQCKIGRSKFCELRPKCCILAGASGTHNVCVCPYHQNVKLMIDGAKLAVDYKDLIELIVCDSESYSCMMSTCQNCPSVNALIDMFSASEEYDLVPDVVSYKKWVTADRADMINVVQPKDEFFESLADKIYSLKSHHFVAKAQGKWFKEKNNNLSENECLVLADFSENFSFLIQDEIQSFHWVNKQVTVHPFVFYFRESGKIKHSSICVLSDHLQHDTATFHAFQYHLIKEIKETVPNVSKLIYFTDGSSSQYKNKKNFANICSHKKDFNLDCEWHYFASAHGKNACDGIGGTTKREVTKASLKRPLGNQILTIDDMYDFCSKNLTAIKYILVKKEEILLNSENIQQRLDACQRVVGTRSFHKIVPKSEGIVRCYRFSSSNQFEDHSVFKIAPITIVEKDLIACVYEERWWLGEVVELSPQNNDVYVHFFQPCGPRTSFKKSESDKVWVPMQNILRKLTPLELFTRTGRSYSISQNLCEDISTLLISFNSRPRCS